MANPYIWKLNGYNLDAAPFLLTADGTTRPEIRIRRNPVKIPGRAGVLPAGVPPLLDESVITFIIRIYADAGRTIEDGVNHLRRICTSSKLSLERTWGSSVSTAEVELISFTVDDYLHDEQALATVTLALPGAVFYEASANWIKTVTAETFTAEIPHLAGAVGPINNAVIFLTGPARSLTIYDEHSGTGYLWMPATPLDTNKILAINCAEGYAQIGTINGIDESTHLDYPPAGRLALWPTPVGSTSKISIKATIPGYNQNTTRLQISAARSVL